MGAIAAQHNKNYFKKKPSKINYIAESDNLGSTDSEVKKILTLHLPISEYDTLGSDSEGDGRVTSQELMSFGHRMRGNSYNFSNYILYIGYWKVVLRVVRRHRRRRHRQREA